MQIVIVWYARAIYLLIANCNLKECYKVSVTAAERVCLGSLLLEHWVQRHRLCSFWGMAFAMTACDGWRSYLCYRRGFYTGALWFLFLFKRPVYHSCRLLLPSASLCQFRVGAFITYNYLEFHLNCLLGEVISAIFTCLHH